MAEDKLDSILDTLAKDQSHGSAELWLLLSIASRGGKARWVELIREYAEARGWGEETARVKLERAYLKLKRLKLLMKRREQKFIGKPRETYVSLTPRARALLLQGC